MKNILMVLIIFLFIRCTQSPIDNKSQNNSNQIEKITMEKINNSVSELITKEEQQNLINGKSISTVMIHNPSHGVLGDGVGALVSKVKGNDKKTIETSNLIIKNPNTIFISYNSDILLKSIKYLSKTEEGKISLRKARFIFADSSLTNVGFINKNEIKELSEQYGFKYSYVE